jgi:hypothetical protein
MPRGDGDRTNSPLKTLADAVNAAKAKPGQVNFASPGNGTVAHLTEELFQKAAGIKTQHVPYKGANQALTDVISGNVELYMSSVPTLLRPHQAGQAARARRHVRQAGRRSAERADDQRVRLQGIRRGHLVRPAGAGRHAEGRDREAECRVQQGAQAAGAQQAARRRRGGPAAARPSSSPR